MKAIRKTSNILFVIWTSCAITSVSASSLDLNEKISCNPNQKTTSINVEANSTYNTQFTYQIATPSWFFNLFKIRSIVKEQRERVIDIVTIEG